jgi:hypothetical protein
VGLHIYVGTRLCLRSSGASHANEIILRATSNQPYRAASVDFALAFLRRLHFDSYMHEPHFNFDLGAWKLTACSVRAIGNPLRRLRRESVR